MNFEITTYDEYIQLYTTLQRDYKARLATARGLCNDLLRDSEATKALESMTAFYKGLEEALALSQEKFLAKTNKYLIEAARELPADINRFKRNERTIKKEHAAYARADTQEMAAALKMFAEINARADNEWLPALTQEIKNKRWDAAAKLVMTTPFYPILSTQNFPEYCEYKLKNLCEKVPGHAKLLEDYKRIHDQGLDYYQRIPRRLMFAAGIKRLDGIMAEEKTAALATAAKFLATVQNDPHATNWVKALSEGMAQAVREHTYRASSAKGDKEYLESLLQELDRRER